MNTVADHPTENHQENGTCGNPRPSNRPAGYVDARCVRCGDGMFVPRGTSVACHEKCPPTSPEHQSAEDLRGLAYIKRRLGNVAFVEFIQTRRYLHFSSGSSATNRCAVEWGCILNVKYGGSFQLASGDNASGAAERAVTKYLEEQAALTEAAEREMEDAERFDGME